MKNLLDDYKKTARNLYTSLTKFQKKQQSATNYYLLLSEYQHTCFVLKQLESYCKARGLL